MCISNDTVVLWAKMEKEHIALRAGDLRTLNLGVWLNDEVNAMSMHSRDVKILLFHSVNQLLHAFAQSGGREQAEIGMMCMAIQSCTYNECCYKCLFHYNGHAHF